MGVFPPLRVCAPVGCAPVVLDHAVCISVAVAVRYNLRNAERVVLGERFRLTGSERHRDRNSEPEPVGDTQLDVQQDAQRECYPKRVAVSKPDGHVKLVAHTDVVGYWHADGDSQPNRQRNREYVGDTEPVCHAERVWIGLDLFDAVPVHYAESLEHPLSVRLVECERNADPESERNFERRVDPKFFDDC